MTFFALSLLVLRPPTATLSHSDVRDGVHPWRGNGGTDNSGSGGSNGGGNDNSGPGNNNGGGNGGGNGNGGPGNDNGGGNDDDAEDSGSGGGPGGRRGGNGGGSGVNLCLPADLACVRIGGGPRNYYSLNVLFDLEADTVRARR